MDIRKRNYVTLCWKILEIGVIRFTAWIERNDVSLV